MEPGSQDENSDSIQYTIRLSDGQTFGPASRQEVLNWARESRIPDDALIETSDGASSIAASLPWVIEARKRAVPPRSRVGLSPQVPPPNAIDHVIPVRNGPALISWYLGVFSLIPILGIPLGIGAIITGLIGLLKVGRGDVKVGFWHGLLGMILGCIGTFGPLVLMVFL